MSSNVNFNLKTQQWTWDINLTPGANTLLMGFSCDQPVTQFNNISMQFDLSVNGVLAQSGEYPPPNVKLISTDQNYVTARRGVFTPDDEITLTITVTNDDVTYTDSQTMTVPRPSQPYPSWTWDSLDKTWVAPEPYPDDGLTYTWDEAEQAWVEADDEDEPQ